MVTFGIFLNKDGITASRCEDGEAEFVRFPPDNQTTLNAEFHVANGQILPSADAETGKQIRLNVDDMTLSIKGADETGVTLDDLLRAICQIVLGDEAAIDKKLVWITDFEDRRLQDAALRAGFAAVTFLNPTAAAIREWQDATHSEGEASDVVVLTVNSDGVSWELRVADEHGYFLSPPDIPHRGCVPAMEEEVNLGKGLARFLEWNRMHGSLNLIVTGNAAQTEEVIECLSLLQMSGHAVCVCENAPVLGGSRPALPSRYKRFDDAVSRILTAKAEGQIETALDQLQTTDIFPSQPEDIKFHLEEIRGVLRAAILSNYQTQTSQQAFKLSQRALELSKTDAERSEAYQHLLRYYCKTGRLAEAEDAAIAASFLDPHSEIQCLAALAEVIPQPDNAAPPWKIQATIKWSSWCLQRNSLTSSSRDIAQYCRKDGLTLPYQVPKLADLLPGAIHRWQDDGNQTCAMCEAIDTEALVKEAKRLLQAAGEASDALLPYLRAEAKGVKFKQSLVNLSTLLAGIGDLDEESPYSNFKFKILTILSVHLEMYYSSRVDEDLWLSVTDTVEHITNHVLDHELKPDIFEEDKAYLTPWQKFCSRLGKKYKKTVTRYKIDGPTLVQIYLAMYRLLHEWENIGEEMVPEQNMTQWVADQLAMHNVNVIDAINDDKFQALEKHLADVWLALFREWHPLSLSIHTTP